MAAPKMFKVKVSPQPAPTGGSVPVGVNGFIVTVPLNVETEVGEDVYEALKSSGYDVTLTDGSDDKDAESTSRYTDVPLGQTDSGLPAQDSKEAAAQRASATKSVDEAAKKE